MKRFKIDLSGSHCFVFGLYYAERTWWSVKWRLINSFEKREEALVHYEKIKDLPQYLD